MRRAVTVSLFLILFGGHALSAPPKSRIDYVKKELTKRGLDKTEINSFFNDARLKLSPLCGTPTPPISWDELEANMLSERSVARGLEFLEQNKTVLANAHELYGVSPEEIAGLLRIETNLGKNKPFGDYCAARVFYHNLSSNRKKRKREAEWVRAAKELVELVIYCKKLGLDCEELRGSSAGAIGIPQFMPQSLIYAKDGNGDGVIDLSNMNDAIVSAANFLEKHGWQKSRKKALRSYYGKGGKYTELVTKYRDALIEKQKTRQ